MSTKIYNGYMAEMDFYRLLRKFKPLVEKFNQVKKAGYAKHLARETAFKIDRLQRRGKPKEEEEEKTPWRRLRDFHDKNEEKVRQTIDRNQREPDLDYTANCVVLPLHKKKTLILFYSDNQEVLDLWESQPFVQDYHYQNQTDQPDNLSRAEWARRKADWDRVLDWNVPGHTGYTFTFSFSSLPSPWWIKEQIEANIPSLEERALHVLHDEYINAFIKQKREEEKTADDDLKMSHYYKAKDAWHEFKKTKEFTAKMAEITQSLQPISYSTE